MNYTHIGKWLSEIRRGAALTGNQPVLDAMQHYEDGWDCRETDPQRALALWQRAQHLAEISGDPSLALYYRYWCCEAYLFYVRDVNAGLDAAVRMVVEARKPQYNQCPYLADVYRTLIDVYMLIDPLGYEDQIREMLAFIQSDLPMDYGTHCLLLHRYSVLEFEVDAHEAAWQRAHEYQALCQGDDYMATSAALWWCYLYYRQGKMAQALSYAYSGEQYARRSDREYSLMMAYFWQALLHQHLGNEETAAESLAAAQVQEASLELKPSSTYYDILVEYYKLKGEWHTALAWREQHIQKHVANHEIYYECLARLKLCCLLGQMKRSYVDGLAATYAAATHLQKPAKFLAKVARVEQGDFDEQKI